MNLNFKQALAILIAILSVLAVSTANLTDLFGEHVAKAVGSASNLLNAIIAGVLTAVTSQTSMVKDVAAMPGVERIRVNAQADTSLATIAMNPDYAKISATPADAAAVAATAATKE